MLVGEVLNGPDAAAAAVIDNDDGSFKAFGRCYERLCQGIVGVFVVISEESYGSMFATKVCVAIETLQLLSFVMSPMVNGLGEDHTTARLVHNLNIFNVLSKALGFDALFYTILAIFLATFSVACYVGYRYIMEQVQVAWMVHVLRRVSEFFVGVGFVPITETLLHAIHCSAEYNACTTEALIPVGVFMLLLFLAATLAISMTQYDPILTSESSYACAHSRISVMYTVSRLLLVIIHILWSVFNLWDIPSVLWVRGVLCFVIPMHLVYQYIWFQPYYNQSLNLWFSVASSWVSWIALCTLVDHLKGYHGASSFDAIMLACVGLPMLVPLCGFLLEHRLRLLREKPAFRVNSPLEFELQIRHYLKQVLPRLREGADIGSNRGKLRSHDHLDSLLDYGGQEEAGEPDFWESVATQEIGHTQFATEGRGVTKKELKILSRVRQMYDIAVHRFSASPLICVFQIYYFQSLYERNRGLVLSRAALLEARKRRPLPDVQFRLVKVANSLRDSVCIGQDIASFVSSERCEREARKSDELACIALLDFWTEFINKKATPDLFRIQALSGEANDASMSAQKAYVKLSKLQPKSLRVMDLYGGFLSTVLNDKTAGGKVLQRAEAMREEVFKGRSRYKNKSHAPNKLEPVIVFEIDGQRCGFGEISYANNDAACLLNSVSHNLVGSPIQSILVPPLSTHLRLIVKQYFEQGCSPFFERAFKSFVLTKDRTCVEVSINLAPYTRNGTDFSFFVSFPPTEELSSEGQCKDSGYLICCAGPGENHNMDGIEDEKCVIGISHSGKMFLNRFTSYTTYKTLDSKVLRIRHIVKNYGMNLAGFIDQSNPRGDGLECLKPEHKAKEANLSIKVEQLRYHGFKLDVVSLSLQHEQARSDLVCSKNGDSSEEEVEEEEDGFLPLEVASNSHNLSRSFFNSPSRQHLQRFRSKPTSTARSKASSAARSEATSRTGASSSSSASVFLRRVLHKETNEKALSGSLVRLNSKYLWTVFITLAVASIYFYIQEGRFDAYEGSILFLNRAGLRRYNLVSIAYNVHALYLLNTEYDLPHGMTETSLRKDLKTNIGLLKSIDSDSFNARFQDELLYTEYTERLTPLPMIDFSGAHVEMETLFEATSWITASSTKLANSPLSEYILENPVVYSLLNMIHGENSYLQHINETTFGFMTFAELQIQSMIPAFLLSAGVAMFSQFLLLVVFIKPLVRRIEKNNVRVLQVLFSINRVSIQTIAYQLRDRLEEVHEYTRADLEERFSVLAVTKEADPRKPGVLAPELPTVDKKVPKHVPVISGEGRNASTDARKPRRFQALGRILRGVSRPKIHSAKVASMDHSDVWSKQNSSNFLWTMAQMSIPGLLGVLYYGLNFTVGFLVKLEYLLQVGMTLNYSGLRRATLRLLKHMSFLYLAGTSFSSEGQDYAVGIDNVTSVADNFVLVNDKLFNGVAEMYPGLMGLKYRNLEQLDLLLENGCYKWRQVPGGITAENCTKFLDGILNGGLATATFQFMETITAEISSASGRRGNSDVLVNSTKFTQALDLEQSYLQNQFTTSVLLYAGEAATELVKDKELRTLMFALFVTFTVLVYLVVIRRVIKRLDGELKRTRKNLLLIPEELYETLPSLKKFISQEYTNQIR